MSHVLDLHEEAMDLADEALRAQRQGQSEQALHFGRLAFERERAAAELVQDDFAAEPTRSVLLRSAATLALDCGEIDEAKRLVAIGLAGTPPPEIRLELQELAEQLASIPPANAPVHPSVTQSTTAAAAISQDLPTDAELMARVASGDVVSIEALYSRHAQVVFSVALRVLGDVELAQESVQETFVHIWKDARQFDGSGAFIPWLLATAHVDALNLARQRRMIGTAIEGLPEPQRQALALAFAQGLTRQEIASTIGNSVEIVTMRIRLGLEILQASLKSQEREGAAGILRVLEKKLDAA